MVKKMAASLHGTTMTPMDDLGDSERHVIVSTLRHDHLAEGPLGLPSPSAQKERLGESTVLEHPGDYHLLQNSDGSYDLNVLLPPHWMGCTGTMRVHWRLDLHWEDTLSGFMAEEKDKLGKQNLRPNAVLVFAPPGLSPRSRRLRPESGPAEWVTESRVALDCRVKQLHYSHVKRPTLSTSARRLRNLARRAPMGSSKERVAARRGGAWSLKMMANRAQAQSPCPAVLVLTRGDAEFRVAVDMAVADKVAGCSCAATINVNTCRLRYRTEEHAAQQQGRLASHETYTRRMFELAMRRGCCDADVGGRQISSLASLGYISPIRKTTRLPPAEDALSIRRAGKEKSKAKTAALSDADKEAGANAFLESFEGHQGIRKLLAAKKAADLLTGGKGLFR